MFLAYVYNIHIEQCIYNKESYKKYGLSSHTNDIITENI